MEKSDADFPLQHLFVHSDHDHRKCRQNKSVAAWIPDVDMPGFLMSKEDDKMMSLKAFTEEQLKEEQANTNTISIQREFKQHFTRHCKWILNCYVVAKEMFCVSTFSTNLCASHV